MSLLKQLLLSVTAVVMVIIVGTLAFSISSARSYLDTQVRAASENTATALAITLSQPANQDPVVRELLLMALFDTGRFDAVTFTDTEGKVLFERRQAIPADAAAAPKWFRTMLPLGTATATRVVSNAWKQVGTLGIAGNNSYAYASLWRNTLGQLVLVLAAGLLWALVAMMSVRWLRKVLNEQVTDQVRAIAQDEDMPRAAHNVYELNALVSEIAQVRRRVRDNVHQMDARIESLRLELNQDQITGLANRKYFLNHMGRVLQDKTATHGHVMLMRIRDLAAINAANNRQEVDAWLSGIAKAMLAWAEGVGTGIQVARLNGSDFAVLMPNGAGPKGIRIAQEFASSVRDMRLGLPEGRSRWAFSLTDYASGDTVAQVMSVLDYGLMRAESAGHDDVQYIPKEEGMLAHAGASESAWRDLLRQALDENDLHLHVSDVLYENKDAHGLQRADAFLQLRDGSEWLSGSLFMPVAVRLNLAAEFDLRAIDLAVDWIKANGRELVLRISLASLAQPRFWPKFRRRLDAISDQPLVCRCLVLELDAHGLVEHPEHVARLCLAAKAASIRVGVRRLDAEPTALAKLHEVPADYIRLTGPLIDAKPHEVGKIELLRAVAATAKELGMHVYSDSPISEAARQLLRNCDVSIAVR